MALGGTEDDSVYKETESKEIQDVGKKLENEFDTVSESEDE